MWQLGVKMVSGDTSEECCGAVSKIGVVKYIFWPPHTTYPKHPTDLALALSVTLALPICGWLYFPISILKINLQMKYQGQPQVYITLMVGFEPSKRCTWTSTCSTFRWTFYGHLNWSITWTFMMHLGCRGDDPGVEVQPEDHTPALRAHARR